MSYLVNDFLINPVLRQARRFSRNTPRDTIDSSIPGAPAGSDENAVDAVSERPESLRGPDLNNVGVSNSDNVSILPLTSVPIEEERVFGHDAQAVGQTGTLDEDVLSGAASRTSHTRHVDHDVSENSFSIPRRFTDSSASSTDDSTNYDIVNGVMGSVERPSARSTLDGAPDGIVNRQRTSSLPEDDGMSGLRQEIIAIQSMDVPPEEKARMMHQLLTRDYSEAQDLNSTKQQPVLPAASNIISQERPSTPGSLASFIWQINGSPDPKLGDQNHTYQLSPNDLTQTFAPPDPGDTDEDGDFVLKDGAPVLGCRHYKRNVKLQCSTCDKWYTCRLCHNEIEDHILDRKATKNMLCMICGCAQRAGEFCVGCGERTAWYYCGVCKLWDNDSSKSIYHCNDCGICRKGRGIGKDFFHCKTCGTCMSMSVEHDHKCIERVSDCDCPICGEYMFTSPSPVVFMLCGHGIHKACYDEHMKTSYKCPICSKSTVNMETQFRNLDRAIESQPMPPQFQGTKAMVSCNDCYAKSAVKYHWLGLRCAICDSYNTAQLSILSDPAVETPLESVETEDYMFPDLAAGEASSSSFHGPSAMRQRRHSTHGHVAEPNSDLSSRFSTYRPHRIGRSVSPMPGVGFFDAPAPPPATETDDSPDDDMDFWGGDDPRNVTSAEIADAEMGDVEELEDDDSDEDSTLDGCDEEGEEEEDEFALFGHR